MEDPYDWIWTPITGNSVINSRSSVVTGLEDRFRVPSLSYEDGSHRHESLLLVVLPEDKEIPISIEETFKISKNIS